jgi:hypothetical protein
VALAPLTKGDIDRIMRATGLDRSVFTSERLLDEEEARALERQDPALKGLVGADRRLVSLAKSGAACVFHSRAQGCRLDFESRPLLCRRFPIVRHRQRLWVNPGGACLALEEAADMPALMALLGIDEAGLAAIDRQIRADLKRPST